ncbi:MAG: hypothetical protein JSR66_13965 [Proteobacteria bacterium]|nr:hypothetical protein [Pseudomonadota bacterium]
MRPGALASVALACGALLATGDIAWAAGKPKADQGKPYEHRMPAQAPFAAVRVLDVLNMPIEAPGGNGWGVRTLYSGPAGEHLRILYVPPGAEGAKVHYHEFHEWAYNIAGDFTNNESTMPDQVYGPLQRFREGNFLSRPPHSLHGGEKGRMKWMASQVGAEILIMEEKDAMKYSYTVDPDVRNGDEKSAGGMHYNPDYKKIQNWATPRIIDTLDKMPWQPVAGSPGLNVKHLIDDPSHGFRADMWFLEAKSPTPEMFAAYHYKQANEFNFVIAGDLNIETYANEGAKPDSVTLAKEFFVEHPAMSIMGLAASEATKTGAVWLQVTYASGAHWSDSPSPIEPRIGATQR